MQKTKAFWKDRIAYQIYPRSFQDTQGLNGVSGDGIGDIPGIISRLDELKDLGIGIIWLSPVYKSPDADNGYDISDYFSIDPKYGTMADMEALFAEAEKRDIKIIMDLVINHTSDEHEWFQKSRDPQSPYRDFYIWRPGKTGPDGKKLPPNNWTGFFMGEVWEFDEKSGEYYLHLFDKKQPDLNYKNPRVVEEIKNILRFWLDKGAAGFRCDVINIIYKTSLEDGKKNTAVCGIEHYKSQEGNHAVLRELRRDVLDKYLCFTVGETVMVGFDEAKLLCDENRRELDMLFYFEHLEIDRRIERFIPKKFRASKLLEVLSKWQRLEWNALYLENHDQSRIVSHFGPEKNPAKNLSSGGRPSKYWQRSAKMLAALELTLRGTPFIFQGQEIGMTNFDYKSLDEVNDVESHSLNKLMKKLHVPGFLRWKWIKASSRDNARTPMQWDESENAGFSRSKPWLAVNSNHRYINYALQKNDPDSVLSFYKKMIALRQKNECLKHGDFIPVFADTRLMVYQRRLGNEIFSMALNFSSRKAKIPKKAALLLSGVPVISNTDRQFIGKALLPWEVMVLRIL